MIKVERPAGSPAGSCCATLIGTTTPSGRAPISADDMRDAVNEYIVASMRECRLAAPSRSSPIKISMSGRALRVCLVLAYAILGTVGARADGCPTAKDAIATDRPDVTNSSLVVPAGSLQSENGLNFSTRDGGQIIDGTNTRWRLGIASCLELLVDLPNNSTTVRGPGSSGFSDVSPAIKWQVSPIPGKVDSSVVFGVGLPTGTVDIAGRGAQPYLQMPWSWELNGGWAVSGMLTEFFRPSDVVIRRTAEATFAIEKNVTEKMSLFVEYVGDYPETANPSQLLNSGGLYRLSPTQQVDFHVAFGLNHDAPSYIVGVGYSFRFDGLFAGQPR
jgi:Putative MetA-pathway of phenol degradation